MVGLLEARMEVVDGMHADKAGGVGRMSGDGGAFP